MIRTVVSLVFIVFGVQAQAAKAADASLLIERVLAAYGSDSAEGRGQTMRQVGRIVSFARGGKEASVTRLLQLPDRLRIEIRFPGEAPEIRVLNGDTGWKNGISAAPPLRDSMALQAARISLPWLLRDRRAETTELATIETPEGARRRVLQVGLQRGHTLVLEIDPDTAMVRRSVGRMVMGCQTIEFSAEYGEFRIWDGIVVATREAQHAMGQAIGYTLLEQVEMGVSLPKGSFKP